MDCWVAAVTGSESSDTAKFEKEKCVVLGKNWVMGVSRRRLGVDGVDGVGESKLK
jgi:hypothetical protein